MKRIEQIKKQIKQECKKSKYIEDWFYDVHLLKVEEMSKWLLKKLPKADKEIVLLGVWLHDLQRIRGIKGEHQKAGAIEAAKVMKKYGYDKDVMARVQEIILTHSCSRNMPGSLEAKILATADAMSHYYNDFFLVIGLTGKREIKEYKTWVLEKLNRNYKKKLFFPFAKKKIKDRHDLVMKIMTMG